MKLRNMPLDSFAEYIKNKEIICFGAGKLLQKVCGYINLSPHVKVVIDNDPNKKGKLVEYDGQTFKIESWEEFRRNIVLSSHNLILISASMVGGGRELYDMLLEFGMPDTVECFFLNFIFAEPKSINKIGYPLEFRLTKRPLIPRYIHYCWFGDKKIPEEQQKFIEGWKEQCPDFEIIRWDESNYDIKKNRYMKKAYEEGRWSFVSDYARKDIIYRYGGIYLDTDVEIIRNFDELLYQQGFAGVQQDNRIASGLGFGGMPELDIMAEMCEVYERHDFKFSDGMTMKVAPDYETEIMRSHGYNELNGLQNVANMTIYPAEVLSGTLPCSNKPFITENTFTVHHYAGSWTVGKRKMINMEAAELYHRVMESERG